MHTILEENDEGLVVCFQAGRIADEATIMEIGDELDASVGKVPAGKKLRLDFRNVEYISSAMVGQLVALRKATHNRAVDLWLCNLSPIVADVLEVMNLLKVFQIETLE